MSILKAMGRVAVFVLLLSLAVGRKDENTASEDQTPPVPSSTDTEPRKVNLGLRQDAVKPLETTLSTALSAPAPEASSWTKEPNAFRRAKLLASEADVRSKFEVGECTDANNAEKTCYFHFELAGVPVMGILTFQRDRLVRVDCIAPQERFRSLQTVLAERYGPTQQATDDQAKWVGEFVSVNLNRSIPAEDKQVITAVALARYKVDLNLAMARWKLQMDEAFEIFKLNYSRYEYEAQKLKAERQLERDKADASANNERIKSGSFSSFSLELNDYAHVVAKRRAEPQRKGADSL